MKGICVGFLALVSLAASGCESDELAESAPDAGADADAAPAMPSRPMVRLEDGPVQGTVSGTTRTFIGIPYAAPPTGTRRWAPPAEVEPWTETLDASGPGVACLQNDPPFAAAVMEREDCLKLNVFAPEPVSERPVPVMVWLHGGNNRIGSANDLDPGGSGVRVYDGAYIRRSAPREVLIVTVNYRLHALGFLAHPALTAEQGASGNYGLMDQQAALRWVQRNIAAFGGDPGNVTIFGESAGATDVCYLLAAKGSEGLFQRAVVESGACTLKLPSRTEWEAEGERYAAGKGCSGSDAAALECLRAKPVDALRPEQPASRPGGTLFFSDASTWGANTGGTLGNVDGKLIGEQLIDSFTAGRFVRVPLIVGSNAREGSLFLSGASALPDEASLMAALSRTYGADAARIAAQYPVASYASANEAAIEMAGDSVFVCTAYVFARLASRHTDVFVYNWVRPVDVFPYSAYGPTHGIELAWVWDWWSAILGGAAQEVMLAKRVSDYWTGFAERGDPNGADQPDWPRYDEDSDPELTFDLSITPARGRRAERCALWSSVRATLWGDAWDPAKSR
jgi:para-nitrobenzyl esterase